MAQQSGPRGPGEDELRKREVRGLTQSGRSSYAEEWRDPEPAGEDQPTGDVRIVPDDRRGTPPGMDPSDVMERFELARFLGRSAFPGDRVRLTKVARMNGAPDRVLAILDRAPDKQEFGNVQEVAAAVGIGTETHG